MFYVFMFNQCREFEVESFVTVKKLTEILHFFQNNSVAKGLTEESFSGEKYKDMQKQGRKIELEKLIGEGSMG